MILNTSNAKRLYNQFDPKVYDKIVRMAKFIVEHVCYDYSSISLKKLDIRDSVEMLERFYNELNPEYGYRVSNIIRQNLRGDIFVSDVDPKYSNRKTFSDNKGLCFCVRKVKKNEFGKFWSKNCLDNSGGVIINFTENIEMLKNMVHELGHKLAQFFGNIGIRRFFYKEVPSITFEKIFLKWLEKEGYSPHEIEQLRNFRKATSYENALMILINNELANSQEDNVELDEIIKKLIVKYSDINLLVLPDDFIKETFSEGVSYSKYLEYYMRNIPYVVGMIMSDYYVSDYYKNGLDAEIFKFVKIYGDNFVDDEMLKYHFMFLNLPFENNNMDELEEYFDGDTIDVEYYDVDDSKK